MLRTYRPSPGRLPVAPAPALPSWVVPVSLVALALLLVCSLVARQLSSMPGQSAGANSVSASASGPSPVGFACIIDNSNSMLLPADPARGLGPRLDPDYLDLVEHLCLSQVGFGREVWVSLVSGSSPASRTWVIPGKGDSLPEYLAGKKACKLATQELEDFFRDNLRGPAGSDTDLVGALERVPVGGDAHRRWRMLLASDGLLANAAVNLERDRVTPGTVDDLVRRSAPQEQLRVLEGAKVAFLLPERAANDRRYSNDLLASGLFWREWLEKYGETAVLTSFNTSAQDDVLGNGGGCK